MIPIRARWPHRRGLIFALIGMGLGCSLLAPPRAAHSGGALLVWVAVMLLGALPMVILELGLGAIFQNALPDSLRKMHRHSEWLGWTGAAIAFGVLILLGALASSLVAATAHGMVAVVAHQPLPWSAWSGAEADPTAGDALPVIGAAALLTILVPRWMRGVRSVSRLVMILVPVSLGLIALLAVDLARQTGALAGLERLLAPDDGWRVCCAPSSWLEAWQRCAGALLIGLGVTTALGSGLNRSSDDPGVGVIATLSALLAQFGLLLTMHLALGAGSWAVTSGPPAADLLHETGHSDLTSPAVAQVLQALSGLAVPAWHIAALSGLWLVAALAVLVTAMLTIGDALVAVLCDACRAQRERVALVMALAAFGGIVLATAPGNAGLVSACHMLLAAATCLQAAGLAALVWRRGGLDALQRHGSAYSAFRLGRTWLRLVVAVPLLLGPAAALMTLVTSSPPSHPGALLGLGIAWPLLAGLAGLACIAWSASRMAPRP